MIASAAPTDAELRALRAASPRALTHHPSRSPRALLAELAANVPDGLAADVYGAGDWLEAFEARVAAELGHEAAVFMPSGTMAQQIAVRVRCDRAGVPTAAYHPTSHLEIHESRGLAMLHGIRSIAVGAAARLMTADDVRAVRDPLGAFVVELPQREIGAQLPPWESLPELLAAIRATGASAHLDGARLWEAAAHYGRPHAEIGRLFESVYVSFYKGLGALAGAVLAGDAGFVAEARVWQHRHGGRLVTIAPLALSARHAFETRLHRIPAYRERAIAVAAELARIGGVDVVPDPPQTSHFHVFLRGDRAELEARAHAYAREHGTFVFARLAPTVVPAVQRWEFVAGESTMALTAREIADAVRAVVAG